MDHPILRAHASLDPNSKFSLYAKNFIFFFKGAEAQSQLRRQGESELDYYERRYQERVNHLFLFSFNLFYRFFQQRLSRGIRPAPSPYDTNAKLTTGTRNNKSPPRRITGGKK
jgi:hypothetical protein